MPERARSTARRLLLIHGAWQGAWSFEAWTPLLAARGWAAEAVDLPGNGWGPQAAAPASLEAYTAHVLERLRAAEGPVALVGHSGGGITATQVAEAAPGRVAAVVYLAGMMLPSGWRYGDLVARCEADSPGADYRGIAPWLRWSADGHRSEVPAEAAQRIFLHDCPPAAAQAAAQRLRPQPESGRAIAPVWTAARAGRVPRCYVECRQDRSVAPALQQAMQARVPGAARLPLDCGHVPQLARPTELSDRLLPWLEAVWPRPA